MNITAKTLEKNLHTKDNNNNNNKTKVPLLYTLHTLAVKGGMCPSYPCGGSDTDYLRKSCSSHELVLDTVDRP